jgi:hypothetical protein
VDGRFYRQLRSIPHESVFVRAGVMNDRRPESLFCHDHHVRHMILKKAASFSPSCIISATNMQGDKHGIDWPSSWGWYRRTNVRSVAQRERQWIFCVVVTNNRYCFDINCIFLAELLLLLVIHSCLPNRGTVNGLCTLGILVIYTSRRRPCRAGHTRKTRFPS